VARHSRKVEHVSVADNKQAPEKKEKRRQINLTGLRDPFLSPVRLETMEGSGCSTGKKCLAIGQIMLKGVVKSDTGMIAVVVNALDKAYFLHENDPVFNGYVVRITGDSVVFKETYEDKLGKPATREVVKRIVTPAV
jgi:Tfp pilus assembly protein PilP